MNICKYGSVSGSRDVARCLRGRSCLVALRDGRCGNDDATFESITFSYIELLCGIYYGGVLWQSWCRSLFDRAQFAWLRFVTGAVTMATRHSIALRSYIYWGGCKRHGRSQRSRVPFVVREGAVTWSRSATGAVTMMMGSWYIPIACAREYMLLGRAFWQS